jgi:alpha-L-rhamnosidase
MREAPTRLRCEYRDNPLNLDTPRPRLSWWLNDARPAEMQTAYQLQAATSADALQAGAAELWDTGHVSSRQTVNVEYRGRPPEPGTPVWWRVRCYDSDGTPSPWSEAARFEVGLGEADWQGVWIASPLMGSPATAAPVPVLFRDFELAGEPVSARLHVAVLGAARVAMNGAQTAGEPFGPWQDPRRRVPVRTWDVGESLHAGRNCLAVLLGDGDCGHVGGGARQRHVERPALCAELIVTFADGRRERIVTGADWRWRPSWILQGDRDAGEEADGRRFDPGWSLPGGAGYPVDTPALACLRVAEQAPPPRVAGVVEPVGEPGRWRSADGLTRLRYDFGRTVLGRPRLTLRAPPGSVVTLRYGVTVPPARGDGGGEPDWAPAGDRYTARGGETETFEPCFALHAFRTIEVCLDREPHDVESLAAVEVAAAAPTGAALRCDHRSLTACFEAAARTLRLGLVLGPVAGLPAARRRAEAADAAAILAGAAATLDAVPLFRGWLTELAAVQRDAEPVTRLPDPGVGPDGQVTVEALLPCLWFVYRCYGDRRLLENLFPDVQDYLENQQAAWPDGIRGAAAGPLGEQLLGTAWYAFALSVAARMAGVLGRLADLEAYVARAEQVRSAFRSRFLSAAGLLVDDDQLAYLLALETGLLEGDERAAAVARLEAQLEAASFHPAVDLRHASLLLEVLTLEGRADLAYRVLLQTTAPGWLHPLNAGADVLWDTTAAVPGRLAGAAVAGWLQRFLLGIELDHDLTPDQNAYRRVRIQPHPPLGPGFAAGAPVREAAGHLDTVHGRFESAWRVGAAAFELDVRVPGNASARVILPDGSQRLVEAGSHHFEMPLDTDAAPAGDIPVLREISGGR